MYAWSDLLLFNKFAEVLGNRYVAARYIAKQKDIPVVLGSATRLFFEHLNISLCLACGTPNSDAESTPYST